VRAGSNTSTTGYFGPHVLVTHGMRVAFADFDVTFRHALQGIHGPKEDRELLVFLAAYLCSPLARFFLFHTTSSWGVYRAEVHLEELLTGPCPLPAALPNPQRGTDIIKAVASAVDNALTQARGVLAHREHLVDSAKAAVTPLIYEYFDVDDYERALVEDTNN